jgi:acetyl esterase/lipase
MDMPLGSDLTLNVTKFDPDCLSPETAKLNDNLIAVSEHAPKWFEVSLFQFLQAYGLHTQLELLKVGAEKYRMMRRAGETTLPKPTILPQGKSIKIPSTEKNRSISCRIMYPEEDGTANNIRGVFMHIHGGGWVLQSESE